MNVATECMKELENYLNQLSNPAAKQRIRQWIRRLTHIQACPDCASLDDLGIRVYPTVDISMLYPPKRSQKAA